jgi:hypothetical protein
LRWHEKNQKQQKRKGRKSESVSYLARRLGISPTTARRLLVHKSGKNNCVVQWTGFARDIEAWQDRKNKRIYINPMLLEDAIPKAHAYLRRMSWVKNGKIFLLNE